MDSSAIQDFLQKDFLQPRNSISVRFHRMVPKIPATYVALTFDDASVGHYTYAYPMLKALNWRGTEFVISGSVGTGGYCTLAQLQEMCAQGWEMGNHTNVTTAFNSFTRREIEVNVSAGKNYIEQNLMSPCLFFSYPSYVYQDVNGLSARLLVGNYHPYGLQGTGTGWDGFPSQSILRQTVTDASYASIPAWIAAAQASAKSLVLLTHTIGPALTITQANFQSALALIQASGVQVKTLRQIADLYSYPLYGYDNKKVFAKYNNLTVLTVAAPGLTIAIPGTVYVTMGAYLSHSINYDSIGKYNEGVYMRVVVSAQGNEAGTSKGIAIYDGVTKLCEVLWDGNTEQDALAGAWAYVSANAYPGERKLVPYIKASSATENMTVWKIVVQLLGDS